MKACVQDKVILRHARKVINKEINIEEASIATSGKFAERARKLLPNRELELFNAQAKENRKHVQEIDLSKSKITKTKAYIIGACLGDNVGNIKPYVKWKGKAQQRYTVGIDAGRDKAFSDEWIKCVKKEYKIKIKRREKERQIITFNSKYAWFDLRKYADFGKYGWSVKDTLFNANKSVVARLLGGFFDAEATVIVPTSIRIEVVNERGLQQIKLLTEKIGVRTTNIIKTRHGKTVAYSFSISQLPSLMVFRDVIGFRNKEKMSKLGKIIENTSKSPRYKYGLDDYAETIKLAKRGFNTYEIGRLLKIPQNVVYRWLTGRRTPLWVKYSNRKISAEFNYTSKQGENKKEIGEKNAKKILNILAGTKNGMSLLEIMEISKLSRMGVFRHLKKLEKQKNVEKVPGKWKIKIE